MTVDFDNVLLELGDFGAYQKFVVYLLCIPACFLNVFNNLGLVFQAYTPSFRCLHTDMDIVDEFDDNCSPVNDSANISLISFNNETAAHCQLYEYSREHFVSTIITDFNLVCDRSIYYKVILSIFNALSILGCFFYSYVQDRWGRKKAFMISLTAYLFGNLSSLFATNLLVFTILRVPSVMGASATWSISYIWALEYVGPSKRAFVTFVMSVLYGIAAIVLGLLAWFCRSWVQLGLVITCPFVLLYLFCFFVDESPRWLFSRGRNEEALKIVRKMAKWQNMKLKDDFLIELTSDNITAAGNDNDDTSMTDVSSKSSRLKTDLLVDRNKTSNDIVDNKRSKVNSTDKSCLTSTTDNQSGSNDGIGVGNLFLNQNLRRKTLLITCIWFSIGITDNTLDYNVENLGGNFYVAYVFQAAVQVPASFLAWLLLLKFGRVLPLGFALIVFCGISSLMTVPAELISIWAVMVCASVAKLGAYLASTIIYQLAVELYPTVLRGCGIGFSSAIADIGTVCMPYVIHSSEAYRLMPMIIVGVFSLISGFSCLFVPETNGQALPETVEEACSKGSVGYRSLANNLKRLLQYKMQKYTASTV